MCIAKFYQINPSSILEMKDELKKTLFDSDPSVMAASLTLHLELTKVHFEICVEICIV